MRHTSKYLMWERRSRNLIQDPEIMCGNGPEKNIKCETAGPFYEI